MKNNIFPVGNKILVKKAEKEAKGGVAYLDQGAQFGNKWVEVVALPDPCLNEWAKKIKPGDLLMVKDFDYDKGVNPDHNNPFAIVDIEPNNGSRPGQVLAWLKK